MKTKRGIWNFVELPHIPKISRVERRYWRSYLSKVIKEGLEVEFNLPEYKGGSCETLVETVCVCSEFETCLRHKKCALHINCQEGSPYYKKDKCGLPYSSVCTKYVEGRCSENIKECTDSCDKFVYECANEYCMNFVPECWYCSQMVIQCKSCSRQHEDVPDPETIRRKIREKLRPTGRVDRAGKSGVLDVTTDGSLRGGGVELISTGRRPTFSTLYKTTKDMLDTAKEQGGFIDERCGIHIHMLAGYYPSENNKRQVANELERPMPQIILANLHQMVRRYQAALVWMTSCLDSKISLTRWEKFRIGIHDLSPMEVSMAELKKIQHFACANNGNGKYGFLSYSGKKLEEKTKFDANGDVEIFHVEFRVPDACWNPSIIASWAYLIYAMLIKAVDLSLYGVMEYAQSPEEAKRLVEEYTAICNNCPSGWEGERVSNTGTAYRYFERYIEDSQNLLEILKPILLEEEPVYGILKDLASKPISIRRIGGETFKDIESTMEKYIPEYHNDEILVMVDESIDLSIFTDCSSLGEWVNHVVDEMVKPTNRERDTVSRKIHEYIQKEIETDKMVWNETTKTLVMRR